MEQAFNITQEFTRALNDLRGPDRRKGVLHRTRSWFAVSPARRTALGVVGALGAITALSAATWFILNIRRGKTGVRRTGTEEARRRAA